MVYMQFLFFFLHLGVHLAVCKIQIAITHFLCTIFTVEIESSVAFYIMDQSWDVTILLVSIMID